MDLFLKVCKALADGTRLEILKLLMHKPFCVNAIAKRFGISQSAVSQHLRVLREAGLVEGNKEGYFVHYSVNNEGLELFHKKANKILDPASYPNDICDDNHKKCNKKC